MGYNSRAEEHLKEWKGDAALPGVPQGSEANRIDIFLETKLISEAEAEIDVALLFSLLRTSPLPKLK